MGLQNHTPSSQVSRLTLALDDRFECEMGSILLRVAGHLDGFSCCCEESATQRMRSLRN